MAILMMVIGGSLTGVMTYMNVGFNETFMSSWLSSFALAALPVGLTIMVVVSMIVKPKIEQFLNS